MRNLFLIVYYFYILKWGVRSIVNIILLQNLSSFQLLCPPRGGGLVLSELKASLEETKSKLIIERHDRENEMNNNKLMVQELQKL